MSLLTIRIPIYKSTILLLSLLLSQQGKCVVVISHDLPISFRESREKCQKMGMDLAIAKTPSQQRKLQNIFDLSKSDKCAYVGLTTWTTMPALYR